MSEESHIYSIIEFISDSGVEVVPSIWISKKSEESREIIICKFPDPIPKGFSRIQANAL
jgi:hypothetical protein